MFESKYNIVLQPYACVRYMTIEHTLLTITLIFQALINTHLQYLTFSLILLVHQLQFQLMKRFRVPLIIRI
jgi:hypothetical protein